MGLHCWSISYSDYHRTDGFVPTGVWPALPGTPGAIRSLVTTGLWEPVAGGYMVHDYLDYNRSRADIEALEQARRLAGQAGGAAKARASPLAKPLAFAIASATANAIPNAIPNAKQDAKQNAKQDAKQNATPRIPDPPGDPGFKSSSSPSGALSVSLPETGLLTPADAPPRAGVARVARDSLPAELLEGLPDEVRARLSQKPLARVVDSRAAPTTNFSSKKT